MPIRVGALVDARGAREEHRIARRVELQPVVAAQMGRLLAPLEQQHAAFSQKVPGELCVSAQQVARALMRPSILSYQRGFDVLIVM